MPPPSIPVFPLIPRFALYGMSCFKCYATPEHPKEVLPCSRCRRVGYCNIECQRADFENHKHFCKAICEVDKSLKQLPYSQDPSTFAGFSVWAVAGFSLRALGEYREICRGVERLLNRGLTKIERSLIMFEPRCGVCYRTERHLRELSDAEATTQGIDPTRKLKRCQDCANIFCCTDDHGEIILPAHGHSSDPNSRCSKLRLMMNDDRIAVRLEWNINPEVLAWVPMRRKIRFTPLLSDSNATSASILHWKRWFDDPSTMFPYEILDLALETMRMLTKGLTLPLTILNAVHHFDSIPIAPKRLPGSQAGPSSPRDVAPIMPLSQRSSLELHIVGAATFDTFGKFGPMYEELLHSLPACSKLTIRFVGPGVREVGFLTGRQSNEMVMKNCRDCRGREVERVHSMHPHLYHEWLPSTREALRANDIRAALPDMVVIFNGSFGDGQRSDRENWARTLLLLLDHSVPTIVTDLNAAYSDISSRLVKHCGGKVIVPTQENPWRNECGTPAPLGSPGFLHQNGYYFCFRGREG